MPQRFPCGGVETTCVAEGFSFFFQAEDGIRDSSVTGVQTCALPISDAAACGEPARRILVEEFVPGPETALEGVLVDGRLEVLALFDKPDPLDGPYFPEPIYPTPSRLPAPAHPPTPPCPAPAPPPLGPPF